MELQWIPNIAANAIHVADCSIRFPELFIDQQLKEDFLPTAARLHDRICKIRDVHPQHFWQRLIQSSIEVTSGQAIADLALTKTTGNSDRVISSALGSMITELIAISNRAFPKYSEQIEFRSRPLQDNWMGFGQGLLYQIAQLTTHELIPDRVRIIPFQPVLNGYCEAHIKQNTLGLEAVLTNPIPELPEILRILWGIAQLNLELPAMSENIGYTKLLQIAPLAVLPPVLAAAQLLELAPCSNEIAEIAIQHWHIPVPADMDVHEDVVPTIMAWWETFLQSKPPMHIGMLALAKMLAG